jgi:heptosyltransferase III
MTLSRFIEIWTFRYYKIIDIFLSYSHWFSINLKIRIYKIFHPKTKLICVLLAEHFGDIVACEPISRALKKQFPDSKLYWIVKKPYRQLLDFNPNIDVVIEEYSVYFSILLSKNNSFDSFHICHPSDLRWYNFTREYLQNPSANTQGILIRNYFDFGNILESFAKMGNLPVLEESPKIYIPSSVIEKINVSDLPKKFIVLHCHSNYSPKDWQIFHWEHLVKDLIEKFDIEIIEIGLKSTLNIQNEKYHNLCGKFTLLETAEIIKRGAFFIGIDSGPAHFANAVGTFGILLFGKLGNFNTYMPYSGAYQTGGNAKFIVANGVPCSSLDYELAWKEIYSTIKDKTF